jgi:hypothetical protein
MNSGTGAICSTFEGRTLRRSGTFVWNAKPWSAVITTSALSQIATRFI